jgi:hypothetical protein
MVRECSKATSRPQRRRRWSRLAIRPSVIIPNPMAMPITATMGRSPTCAADKAVAKSPRTNTLAKAAHSETRFFDLSSLGHTCATTCTEALRPMIALKPTMKVRPFATAIGSSKAHRSATPNANNGSHRPASGVPSDELDDKLPRTPTFRSHRLPWHRIGAYRVVVLSSNSGAFVYWPGAAMLAFMWVLVAGGSYSRPWGSPAGCCRVLRSPVGG